MHRVQKLLSNFGYCSRRKAEDLINQGKVQVNGKIISIGDKAAEDDKIYVEGKPVSKQKKVYILFHKPKACVTALTDDKLKTIMQYIDIPERIFPIGRLDYNTTGALLLTNDGDFANSIMHPRYEIKKTYVVGLRDHISDQQILQIKKGILLEDGKTSPAHVKKISDDSIEIIIHEGKNRIIRRIFDKLNIRLKFLKRVKVGELGLGKLKPSEFKFLTDNDKSKLLSHKS